MLLKLPAKFCPLAERLGTSQGRNITEAKEVTPFPDYFFSCDYDFTHSNVERIHSKTLIECLYFLISTLQHVGQAKA